MFKRRLLGLTLIGSLALAPLSGCESLPGDKKTQGAVIGGAGGAAAGAAIGKNNRLLGALIGGVVGAGGGYLIGTQLEKADPKKRDEAIEANRKAETTPARAEDVDRAKTADLNTDGYVTLDEVVAMKRAGLSEREMLDRLRATRQVFELTTQQEQYLMDQGVSRTVVTQMRDVNQDVRDEAYRRYPQDDRSNERIDRSPPPAGAPVRDRTAD